MKATLCNLYTKHAYCHNYIFGYVENGKVYAAYTTASALPAVVKLDRASRGNGYSIRFKGGYEEVEALKKSALKIEYICSEEFLEQVAEEVSTGRKNRGSAFEKILTEKVGQVWKKDSVPFTEAPDLVIDGIGYQIKYKGATFANEAQLNRLEAKAEA